MYPHLLSSREIIGNLDSLLEALGQARGREFELPVALLFHLLGFYTGHYGFRDWPAGKSAPDIVAFPDSGNWFLVVEATGREPDLGNKMGKLATRTKELQRVVEGRLAYPVIITALDRKIVNQSDLGKAESELISVVTADELSLMVQMVAEGMTPAKVRDFLERLIPRVEGAWTKSWPRP